MGTRVPVKQGAPLISLRVYVDHIFDIHLPQRQFPSVSREQATAALELSKESLFANYEVAA